MLDWYLPLHLLPLVLMLLPMVLLTFKKWHWRPVDLLAVFLPGLTWFYLVGLVSSRSKSLSNFIELPLLAVIVAALAFTKPRIERSVPAPFAKYVYLILTLAATIAVYFCFPGLDE